MTKAEAAPKTKSKPPTSDELMDLPLDVVTPSQTNPRLDLDKERFQELKASIEKNGLVQPIAVRRLASGTFEIIGGHRRFAAVSQLAKEHPSDRRFQSIAALVKDVTDELVPVLQLAENINRADLSPLEVAEGIARVLQGGALSADALADQLGWNRRNVKRYQQLHDAPAWLKSFANEVKVPVKKRDERGDVVLDKETNAPVVELHRYPGLPFTYVFELLTAYNVLHDKDLEQLQAEGGDDFKPQAERIVRKLAIEASVQGWTTAKLREQIKLVREPKKRSTKRDDNAHPPVILVGDKLSIEMKRAGKLTEAERSFLLEQLSKLARAIGFSLAAIEPSQAK